MQSSIREAWLSQISDARYMIRRGFLAQTRKKAHFMNKEREQKYKLIK